MAARALPVAPTRRTGRWSDHLLLHIILIAGSIVMLVPFIWMVTTSLKPAGQFAGFIPRQLVWENYRTTVQSMPFGRFYINSLVVASAVTILQLLTSSLAAFAFARLQFPGRDQIFLLYLVALMIPFPVTMLPNFILVRYLGWVDTYAGLIIPTAFSAFSTFMLRQQFRGIPLDLDQAARIDGASSFRIWWQVLLPLAAASMAALAIFNFLGSWNDFLWPLLILKDRQLQTLPPGLRTLQGAYTSEYGQMMAGAVIAAVPVLILYVALQKYIVQSVATTGLAGQ